MSVHPKRTLEIRVLASRAQELVRKLQEANLPAHVASNFEDAVPEDLGVILFDPKVCVDREAALKYIYKWNGRSQIVVVLDDTCDVRPGTSVFRLAGARFSILKGDPRRDKVLVETLRDILTCLSGTRQVALRPYGFGRQEIPQEA